jgi:hypothetical protein
MPNRYMDDALVRTNKPLHGDVTLHPMMVVDQVALFDVLVLVGGSLISSHGFSHSAVNKEWTVYDQVGPLKDVD